MEKAQPSFKRELLAALPSLRAFAISLIGRHDRADDLVQDTIMRPGPSRTISRWAPT
jgi:RNA polymerase sigma-70 factor (ECF subfamily)